MSVVLDEVLAGRPAGLSLDEFEAAADEWAAAERKRDTLVELARAMLAFALGSPGILRKEWQVMIRQPLPELYALRERFEGKVRALLTVIDTVTQLQPHAVTLAGGPLDGADGLAAARAELTAFAERILSHWTSEDELADIACETFVLPEWLTKGPIPPHLQPPQSWWEDEDDPFQPLPDAP